MPQRIDNIPTNFRRLSQICLVMAHTLQYDWRFEKYIEKLDELFAILKSDFSVNSDFVKKYERRMHFIKGIISVNSMDTSLGKAEAMLLSPKSCESATRIIQQKKQEEVKSLLREDLFSATKPPNSDGLRYRILSENRTDNKKNTAFWESPESPDTGDVDAIIKLHHDRQERIANTMLSLAKDIKEQSLAAGDIIRLDAKKAAKSALLAERNITDLNINSTKLVETSRDGWNLMIWILLLVVLIVFINMVLFMKITKKT